MTTSIILLVIGKLEPLRGQRMELHHSLRYAASASRSVKKQSETSLSPCASRPRSYNHVSMPEHQTPGAWRHHSIGRRGKKGCESDVEPHL